MEPERKLQKAKLDVMRSTLPGLRLWAGIMSIGETHIVEDIPTACTDGRNEYYGREFVVNRPHKQLSFVCLHESVHKGLRHLLVWRKLFELDPEVAALAVDYVTNAIIVRADPEEKVCAFPRHPDGSRMGLYEAKYADMSVLQVFNDIRKQRQQQQQQGSPQPGSGQAQPGQGFDEHDWAGAKEMSKEEQQVLEVEIDHALRQGEIEAKKLVGSGAGGIHPAIGELLRPQIKWEDALREFLTAHTSAKDDSTYRRINRRFHALDLILPTSYGEGLGHIAVGADLSVSMWHGDPSPMSRIFSELAALAGQLQPEKLDLLYWDTHVAGHETYTRGQYEGMREAMRPKGGGGTSPGCVPRYLREKTIKPDCIVMLTDGEVGNDWGEHWPAPILWVVCGNRNIWAGTGKTVHVD